MEMTIKAEQARSMVFKAEAELHSKAMEEAEKCIREKVEKKIAFYARSGNRACLITYFNFEEEVYKCVARILEENGYKVEILNKSKSNFLALGIRW